MNEYLWIICTSNELYGSLANGWMHKRDIWRLQPKNPENYVGMIILKSFLIIRLFELGQMIARLTNIGSNYWD